MNKKISLYNVQIQPQKIILEFVYKFEQNNQNINIYLAEKDNKYSAQIYKNEETKEAKVVFVLEENSYGKLKLKLQIQEETIDLKIVDNKENKISAEGDWYSIFTENTVITITEAYIQLSKKHILDKLKYEIHKHIYCIKEFKKIAIYRLFKTKPKYYLFNDRLMYGDDNAEELFAYVNKHNKKMAKKSYFILDKKSEAIKRIKKKGKILKYGSIMHKIKFVNAKMIISSHASYYDNCYNPFTSQETLMYKDIITKKFVFIQHGVAMNNIQEYVNRTKIIADLYTTSTKEEYKEISNPQYMYKKDMIILTGLPRFDKLTQKGNKIILISPTWRANLSEKEYGKTIKEKIEQSEYYNSYKKLLTDKRIIKTLEEKGYKIKFLLHPVFAQYEDLFENLKSKNVEILKIENIRYSDLFNECSMLITDYSSIHFDVATLKKPIIYYQFDKKEFFTNHYKKGYFSYEDDGFGKVIEKYEELITEIIRILNKDCNIDKIYADRIENTFKYLDKNNCKRVLEEIIKLDQKNEKDYRFNDVN